MAAAGRAIFFLMKLNNIPPSQWSNVVIGRLFGCGVGFYWGISSGTLVRGYGRKPRGRPGVFQIVVEGWLAFAKPNVRVSCLL